MKFFEELFRNSVESNGGHSVEVLLASLGAATVLGAAVAGLYLWSCRHRESAPGLPSTLVLLSILITMVTMAIGDRAATAFTLVGTLAIVRFRTPVRDIRDTAFVILAVAVGLSNGADNIQVAIIGTGFVALVVVCIGLWTSRHGSELDADGWARLDLRLEDPSVTGQEVDEVLKAELTGIRLLSVRRDKDEALRMSYSIHLRSRSQAPKVIDAVTGNLKVRRAIISFEDDDLST